MSVFSEVDEAQFERWLDVSDSDASDSDGEGRDALDDGAAARGDAAIARTEALGRHVVATRPLAASGSPSASANDVPSPKVRARAWETPTLPRVRRQRPTAQLSSPTGSSKRTASAC